MRVIAGSLRSRKLDAPSGMATRPTSDRLRESLFNVLAPRIEGARFLDLFAGSGAVGIEALSRGAALAVFVEKAPPALSILRANLANLGLTVGYKIHSTAATAWLRRAQESSATGAFDIVFLDPPYDAETEYNDVLTLLGGAASSRLAPQALIIAEHRRQHELPERCGALVRTRILKQGDASLSFYALDCEAEAPR